MIAALGWWSAPRPVTAASNTTSAALIGVNVDNVTLAYEVQKLSTVVHIGAARVAWTNPPDYTSRTYTLPDADITALARYQVQILDILFSCTILNDQNRLNADEARMDHVHALVGRHTPVWWEFGNEVVRSCATNNTPRAYTVMWNMLIPTLKQRYLRTSSAVPRGRVRTGLGSPTSSTTPSLRRHPFHQLARVRGQWRRVEGSPSQHAVGMELGSPERAQLHRQIYALRLRAHPHDSAASDHQRVGLWLLGQLPRRQTR